MAITRLSYTSTFKLFIVLFLSALSACNVPSGTNTPAESAPGLIRKAFAPTWSPSGERLAFLYRYRAEGSQTTKDAIFSILQNGTDLIKVRDVSPARFSALSWSPNGNLGIHCL